MTPMAEPEMLAGVLACAVSLRGAERTVANHT
jgi:hypothetical protein